MTVLRVYLQSSTAAGVLWVNWIYIIQRISLIMYLLMMLLRDATKAMNWWIVMTETCGFIQTMSTDASELLFPIPKCTKTVWIFNSSKALYPSTIVKAHNSLVVHTKVENFLQSQEPITGNCSCSFHSDQSKEHTAHRRCTQLIICRRRRVPCTVLRLMGTRVNHASAI